MVRHRFEVVSLVFGLIFAGVGMVFLLGEVDLWDWNWAWFWPAALTLSGLMVLASLRAPQRDSNADTAADSEEP